MAGWWRTCSSERQASLKSRVPDLPASSFQRLLRMTNAPASSDPIAPIARAAAAVGDRDDFHADVCYPKNEQERKSAKHHSLSSEFVYGILLWMSDGSARGPLTPLRRFAAARLSPFQSASTAAAGGLPRD